MGSPDHDVGLILLNRAISFTNTIRPVCLPFYPKDEDSNNDKYSISSGYKSDEIRFVETTIQSDCEGKFDTGHCGRHNKGKCGDISGGYPVLVEVGVGRTARQQQYYVQESIALGNCKDNIEQFLSLSSQSILTWIQKETQTSPVLVSYGGQSKTYSLESGYETPRPEVEVVSGQENPGHCSGSFKQVFEKLWYSQEDGLINTWEPDLDLEQLPESAQSYEDAIISASMSAKFVNDAVIMCGGKFNNITKRCYQYDFISER